MQRKLLNTHQTHSIRVSLSASLTLLDALSVAETV